MNPSIKCAESHSMFRKKLLEFIRPIGNSTCRVHDPIGIKRLNRLRAGFSHLRENKFRHNFANTLNPLCACALETECTKHFFLRCHNTGIYSFISVPQITRFLLGDVIISSKTEPHNVSKKEKRSYGKSKTNKTTLKILSFIQILYLKQESSILRCYSRLKFEKSLFSNTFFSFIFRSKMIVHTAEKEQMKYFVQN